MALIKLLDYLNRRTGTNCNKDFNQLNLLIKDLRETMKDQNDAMQDQRDAVREQTTAIREQTKAITALYTEAKLNSQALSRVTQDVSELRNNCPRFAMKGQAPTT